MTRDEYKRLCEAKKYLSGLYEGLLKSNISEKDFRLYNAADSILVGMLNATRNYSTDYRKEWDE